MSLKLRLSLPGKILISALLIGAMASCEKPGQNRRQDAPSLLSIERWPGEGVPVLAWQGSGDSLEVYPLPETADTVRSAAVKVGRIAVTAGQKLLWDRSVILVEKPGQMEIVEDCIIAGFVYDAPDDGQLKGGRARQIYFSCGTILEVICYAAEGFYIFRHDGEYIEMDAGHRCQQMLAEPQTQWWVRITRDGSPAGWVPVDGTAVAVVERRF